MKKLSLSLEFSVYDTLKELEPDDKALLEKAVSAMKNAYAPYSNFRVGAAVILDNGKIFLGNNQENAAYPSGLCAERVALFYASSVFPDVPVKAIAVTAASVDFIINDPVTPCGSCRQVMAETEDRGKKSMKIIMMGEHGKIYITEGVNNLLPLMFQAEQLKK